MKARLMNIPNPGEKETGGEGMHTGDVGNVWKGEGLMKISSPVEKETGGMQTGQTSDADPVWRGHFADTDTDDSEVIPYRYRHQTRREKRERRMAVLQNFLQRKKERDELNHSSSDYDGS